MSRTLPWAFLGLFASPAKLFVVLSALLAFAWRMGWLQRFLFQALSRQMMGPAPPSQARQPTPEPNRSSTRPNPVRFSTGTVKPGRRLNWRKVILVLILMLVGVLFVTRVHMAWSVSRSGKSGSASPASTQPTSSNP